MARPGQLIYRLTILIWDLNHPVCLACLPGCLYAFYACVRICCTPNVLPCPYVHIHACSTIIPGTVAPALGNWYTCMEYNHTRYSCTHTGELVYMHAVHSYPVQLHPCMQYNHTWYSCTRTGELVYMHAVQSYPVQLHPHRGTGPTSLWLKKKRATIPHYLTKRTCVYNGLGSRV